MPARGGTLTLSSVASSAAMRRAGGRRCCVREGIATAADQFSPPSARAGTCGLCLQQTRLCVSPKQSLTDGRRPSRGCLTPGRPRRGRRHRGAPDPVAHGHRQLRALRGRIRVRVPGARGRRPGAAGDRRGVAARAPRRQGRARGALPVGGAGAVAPRRRRRGRPAGARARPGHERQRQRAAAQAAARRARRLRGRRPRAHARRAAVRPPPSSECAAEVRPGCMQPRILIWYV